MSKGYRNGAFSLGLVTGGGLALNLFLWLDYTAKTQTNRQSGTDDEGHYSEIGDWWDRLIGTFISPSDTLAQWIMAIFTVVAVVVIWRTLVATREMVRDTKQMTINAQQIGEAQVRAYIRCSKVTCKPPGKNKQDDLFSLLVELQNFGQSPASIVQLLVGIELMRFDGTRAGKPIQINSPTDPAMAPQGVTTAMLSFGYAIGAADEVRNSKAYMRFTVVLVFDDVFGKRDKSISYHHTEGSLLDSGITASHIVSVKPEHKPQ